jgi:hypothetical protein
MDLLTGHSTGDPSALIGGALGFLLNVQPPDPANPPMGRCIREGRK